MGIFYHVLFLIYVIFNPLVYCYKYIQCGPELHKDQSGTFGPVVKYHRYRYFTAFDQCSYKIRPRARRNKIIVLDWLKFNIRSTMPSCYGSYIEVFIG